jgi:hypothetical protein
MADNDNLLMYIQYKALFVSEYRGLLSDIEKSYNKIDAFFAETQRVRRHRRLQISSVQTGRSIEIILSGTGESVVALVLLATLALKLRKTGWESEGEKWKARLAQRQYEEKYGDQLGLVQRELEQGNRFLRDAMEFLMRAIRRTEDSTSIISLDLNVIEPKNIRDDDS